MFAFRFYKNLSGEEVSLPFGKGRGWVSGITAKCM
jgi:hypothetical protein